MDEGYSRTKNFTAPSPRITLDELEGPSLRDHEANDGWMVCMEGERKVILSALTSVGYIRYYIVSVYQVYGVQRSYLREREEKNFFFFYKTVYAWWWTRVYVCMCMCVSVSVRWSNHGKYWFYRKLLPTKMMQLKGDATLGLVSKGWYREVVCFS